MRARASRCGLVLLTLITLSGCSSVTKQNYLRHLSMTIKPVQPDERTVATVQPDPGVVVVTPSDTPRP